MKLEHRMTFYEFVIYVIMLDSVWKKTGITLDPAFVVFQELFI